MARDTKLRRKRLSKGVSITFMSKRLGYKYPSGYANIESGRVKPDLQKARIICDILGTDINSLFFDEKLPEKSNRKQEVM
ncbi:MAG: helix-turn-helix transcriptional regulator [Sporolactobacillus sp.]